jgi:hypothetical protein
LARSSATVESSTKPPADNPAAQKKSGMHVPRAVGTCGHCQRPIAPGEKFTAALRETLQGLERLDRCEDCRKQEGFDPTGLLCFWQTVMPAAAEQKKNLLVDDEVLCTLFERLGEAAEPMKVQFRFVLGLILIRKRLVVYESTRHDPDGRDVWLVHMKGSQTTLELADPKLTEQQVAEVSGQLGQILSEEG